MEVIVQFCEQNKNKLQDIFNKECNNDINNHIILINYSKMEDIKVACVKLDTIEKEILTDLAKIKKKINNNSNENYAIIINTNITPPINIINYIH